MVVLMKVILLSLIEVGRGSGRNGVGCVSLSAR